MDAKNISSIPKRYNFIYTVYHEYGCPHVEFPRTKCMNDLVYMRNTQYWIRMSLPLSFIGGGSSHVWITDMSFVLDLLKWNIALWIEQINENAGMESAWLCTYFSSNCTTVFSSWQQFFFFSFWQHGGRSDVSSWQWFCWLMKNEVKIPSSSQACVNTGIPIFPKNRIRLKNNRVSVFTIRR